MKLYVSNLLRRLREFSQTLDKKEILIDAPWVIIDSNQNQQKYIFKRDGDLVISLNGEVTDGRWEYLSSAKSLLINTGKSKVLLNQDFIDPAVMVLRKDGLNNESLILANQNLLPDLDVVGYLQRLFYQKHQVSTAKLKTGEVLELHYYEGWVDNNKVTIESETVEDGTFELESSNHKYVITAGRIQKVLTRKNYETKMGTLTVELERNCDPRKGDLVFLDNKVAPDGKYRIGLFKHILVENGEII